MRMLVRVTFPVEPFNTYVKDGSASAKMGRILGELKPEAAYFTEFDGQRTALLVIHMDDCSQIPALPSRGSLHSTPNAILNRSWSPTIWTRPIWQLSAKSGRRKRAVDR